jgi:hypothetical protein
MEELASSLFSVGRNVRPLLPQTALPTSLVFLGSADRGSFLRPGLTFPKASRAAAVKDGPGHRACAARSVLDGGEHGARLEPVGHTVER